VTHFEKSFLDNLTGSELQEFMDEDIYEYWDFHSGTKSIEEAWIEFEKETLQQIDTCYKILHQIEREKKKSSKMI